jgi:prepilin-type N-terminal cleavage/methylation domain-containing protein
MDNKNFSFQRGLSLVELLIVLVVAAILTTVALTQLGSAKTDFQRQNIAREFKIYLERARFDSVKRRPANANDMSRVILSSSTSFTAIYDRNQNGTILASNGTIETADRHRVDFTDRSDAQILVSDTLNYPVTIRFDHRGQITAVDASGNEVTSVFTICSRGNCTGESRNVDDLTVISVSSTGTIAILPQGQTPSALPTPSISGTPPRINCQVFVTNSNTMCTAIVY